MPTQHIRPKTLGIIPARASSKGIPGKNLLIVGGRPLIAWACLAAASATRLEKTICSSDSDTIIAEAARHGVCAPFKRPETLAQDDTLIVEVLCHALTVLSEFGENYQYICLIQATSPLIMPQDIDAAVDLAIQTSADTVISGYRCGQRHPAAMFTLRGDGSVDWLLPAAQRMARRQDLPPVFMRSGLVYVFRVAHLMETRQLYGPCLRALEVPEERALSVDTELDLLLADFLLTKQKL